MPVVARLLEELSGDTDMGGGVVEAMCEAGSYELFGLLGSFFIVRATLAW